jgi:hypothetical protein
MGWTLARESRRGSEVQFDAPAVQARAKAKERLRGSILEVSLHPEFSTGRSPEEPCPADFAIFRAMTHDFLQLPAFACIGQEMEGPLSTCQEWVPRLWARCRIRYQELDHLEKGGNWGLMSDTEIFLAPWGGERGRYLAGCQVPVGTTPFGDWKVWEIPARTWMRIPCRVVQIGEALEHARTQVDNKNPEWRLEGAVHESYPDDFRDPAVDTFHLMVGVMPR